MKEYLVKDFKHGYFTVKSVDKQDDWIEIPEGAELCTKLDENVIFWSGSKNKRLGDSDWLDISFTANDYIKEYKSSKIIWQREPKYKEFLNANDNYNLVMLPEYAGDDERSGLIEVPGGQYNFCYKSGVDFAWTDKESNDYGELLWQRNTEKSEVNCSEVGSVEKTVDSTLSERQASYGCFEDVAFVTENIINVLKKCNYDSMPNTHKMAMYMIASKMARLVNGDCNHLDSWHDIQGYAKLVEKTIEP